MGELRGWFETARALAVPLAIVLLVVEGGLLAKRLLWTGPGRWRELGRRTMRAHAVLVGGLLGAIPGGLPGAVVERIALGLVLGGFATLVYARARSALTGQPVEPVDWGSRPPPAPAPNDEGEG